MISVQAVNFAYDDAKQLLKNISFSVKEGEIIGIVGPNGSGKTTLLKLLSRTFSPSSGEVTLQGKNIQKYTQKELAKKIAVLSQKTEESFSYSVYDTVSLGRYAYQQRFLPSWSKEDEEIVREAMVKTEVSHLEKRTLPFLSGGERQRVYLAQALAQQPSLLLLDEPTNHLDIKHSIQLFQFLQTWVQEQQASVIAIFHDLNLASMYCDHIFVLQEGEIIVSDTPQYALTEPVLQDVYHPSLLCEPHPLHEAPIITYAPSVREKEIRLSCQNEVNKLVIKAQSALHVMSSLHGTKWAREFVYEWTDERSASREDTVPFTFCSEPSYVVTRETRNGDMITVIVTEEKEVHVSLFVNGMLSEVEYLQYMLTIASMLHGFTTHSILVASTQQGTNTDIQLFIREAIDEVTNKC
jgi:iron complex transport system ATP-binding protein